MKIELSNICKSFYRDYKRVDIFRNLNLLIKEGEFVSIIGPNGCGKTTLLNIIDGVDTDFSGGRIATISERAVITFGYMLQKDLLLPWRTVFNNIILGLEIRNAVGSSDIERIEGLLRDFGILNLRNVYPSDLSGGERQKIALIRTFVLDADVLLLDEPFSSIDYRSRLELQSKVLDFSKTFRKTAVLVTHDVEEAIALSDRVVVLGEKPLGIIKDIPIEISASERRPVQIRRNSRYAGYYQTICELIGIENEK